MLMRAKLLAVILLGAVWAQPAACEPALWVVKSGHATVYLFGTVHALKAGADWFTPKIRQALDSSQTLCLEVANPDDKDAARAAVAKYGFDRTHSLHAELSTADQARLTDAATAYGIPAQTLDTFKPWLAAAMVDMLPLSKAGYSIEAGVEHALAVEAAARSIPIIGFETVDEQTSYLAGLLLPYQIDLLHGSLLHMPDHVALTGALAQAWQRGDVEAVDRVGRADGLADDPMVYDALMLRRNERFAARIAQWLTQGGTTFAAMGAAHLAGADSVQIELGKLGFKPTRL